IESHQNGLLLSNMEFDGIKFCGNTLNHVFDIDGMQINYKDGKTILTYNDDSILYRVVTPDYSFDIAAYSLVKDSIGIHGNSISNTETTLTLTFDKPQPLIKIFEHYNKMKDLLSFMTFRNNVGFDKIFLMKTHPILNRITDCAEIFIKNEDTITQKEIYSNITFSDLGNSLPNLLQMLYNNDKKSMVSLGFIPESDEKAKLMTDTRIKEICSALEHEAKLRTDIKLDENTELNELIERVKDSVKNFQDTHYLLSDDTYNLIFSSIGVWSQPLVEKLCALYHEYNKEMNEINRSSINITDELIRAFVKYRNDITHGRHRVLNTDIAVTAHYLCGLIYFCVLERIGVSREKIRILCREKIIS
ncbi:MAG: hypothetical protein ACI4J7_11790, partial [Ruminiclostridium sp.]